MALRSVAERRPVVELCEDADASIYLQRIARKLLAIRERDQQAADPTGRGRTPDS